MAAVKDNFADIDFDEITEATALEVDEIKVLKLHFGVEQRQAETAWSVPGSASG